MLLSAVMGPVATSGGTAPTAQPLAFLNQNDAPYIAGQVWFDANSNGILEAGEDPLPFIEVDLLDANNGNQVVQNAISDNNGNYAFTNLPTGKYIIQVVKPPTYIISPQNVGPNLAAQSFPSPTTGLTAIQTLNFFTQDDFVNCGMYATPAPVIGGLVFNDANANGVFDVTTEKPIQGVNVNLFTPGPDGQIGTNDDVLVATTLSAKDGSYLFPNSTFTTPNLITLAAGNYYVNFVTPGKFFFSPQAQGPSPTLYSWPDQFSGDTPALQIPFAKDRAFTQINCGMFQETLRISGPKVGVSNFTVDRPSTGTTPALFQVTILPANFLTQTVPYFTADGPAPDGFTVDQANPAFGVIHGATVANNDYTPAGGTLTFAPGVTLQTFTVDVLGRLDIENDVAFTAHIVDTGNQFIDASLVSQCEIINTNFASAAIGNFTGQRQATSNVTFIFDVTLSAPSPFDVEVDYSTLNYQAVQDKDFVGVANGAVFIPALNTDGQAEVTVLPGTAPAVDRAFHVNLIATTTAILGTPAQGSGTILTNAPPQVTVTGGQVTESLTGLALLPFTITVAPALTTTETISYSTADGTAVAGLDYAAQQGTLTFGPGNLTQVVNVPVFRRFLTQQDKTVTMTIGNPGGTLLIPTATATGTIHDLATVAEPLDAKHKVVYTDYLRNKVSITVKGIGTGTLVFLGTSSVATDAYLILLNTTDSDTSLQVKTAANRQTTFHAIQITGAMGSIIAKTSNLLDQLTVSGSLNSLSLNYLAAATITIGSGSGSLALVFNRVLDTSITSGVAIKSLTAADYLNTDGVPDTITAPSVGPIKVKGKFQAIVNGQQPAAVRSAKAKANLVTFAPIGTAENLVAGFSDLRIDPDLLNDAVATVL